MDIKTLTNLYSEFFKAKYGVNFICSESMLSKLLYQVRSGKSFDALMDKHHSILAAKTNYPFYWMNSVGCDYDTATYYSKNNKTYSICPWCNIVYDLKTRFKSCCCESCYIENRKRGAQRLSASRLKYNSNDPIQYANRHGLSIEESTEMLKKRFIESSVRRVEYWINKGYSEEDAKQKVSEIQSGCSPRHESYWINKGYSEEDAKQKVSEIQTGYVNTKILKYNGNMRKFSHWCYEYWEPKGYTLEEYKEIVSGMSKKAADDYVKNVPLEIRKKDSHFCIEYWQKRHPENYEELYQNHLTTVMNSSAYKSKIAIQFCEELSKKFNHMNTNRYYGNNEYGKYDKNLGYMKFDYVDTTLGVCVEFNGDYWHGNPQKYKSGDIIKFPNKTERIVDDLWKADVERYEYIENQLGFRLYVVWESDYRNEKDSLVNELYEVILNENFEN